MGKPVIMGRKTWESLPKRPLPGRTNIVVTRDQNFSADGARVLTGLDAALACGLAIAQADGADEVCVIGGAEIYSATLPRADRIRLTEVDIEPQGDATFPALDKRWREVHAETVAKGANDDAGFVVRTLERA